MKINNKFKLALQVLAITSVMGVSISVPIIVACSKNNAQITTKDGDKEKTEEQNIDFDNEFIKNTKDLSIAPKDVDTKQYEFLLNYIESFDGTPNLIHNKLEEINAIYTSSEEARNVSKKLLDKISSEDLKTTLLVNFNKYQYVTKKISNDETNYTKKLFTIESFVYDYEKKLSSFVLDYNYSFFSEPMNDSKKNVNLKIFTKFKIKFTNIELNASSYKIGDKYIPIIGINKDNFESNIEYIYSECKINLDDFFKKQKNILDMNLESKSIEQDRYDEEMSGLLEIKNYWTTLVKLTNEIINQNFMDFQFINENENIYNTPFISKDTSSINNKYNDYNKYDLSEYNIGLAKLCEIMEYNDEYELNLIDIVRIKYGVPAFNFISINNKNNELEFITSYDDDTKL